MTTLPTLAGPDLSRDDLSAMAIDLYGGAATGEDFARLGSVAQQELLALLRHNNRIMGMLTLVSGVGSVATLCSGLLAATPFAAVCALIASGLAAAGALALAGCAWMRGRQIRRLAAAAA